MPNSLNRYTSTLKTSVLQKDYDSRSVALEKTVIDSSGLKTCVHSDDPKAISEKSRGFELYSRDNCEVNFVQQVRSWNLEMFRTECL